MRDVDWRTLMALGGGADPKLMIALAFRELAENATKIGELNITPDLLKSLMTAQDGEDHVATYEKLVLVTRRTRLEELIDRFNTKGQAKFYIERAGGDFGDYESEHDAYHRALDRLRRDLDFGVPRQFIDRSLVPTYTFGAA